MSRKRKPLNDALASSFVYGQNESNFNEAETETTNSEDEDKINNTIKKLPVNNNKKISMIEKLQIKQKEATKRFTVDLPESQHRKLSILAAKTGRTKADIVRMLLEEALEDTSTV